MGNQRRKRLYEKFFPTFKQVIEYVNECKRINKNRVQIEISEEMDIGHGWFVTVWGR